MWLQLMNAMVPDDEQDGSKTVHSWFYTKILLIVPIEVLLLTDMDMKLTEKDN
jgi:hypothetical protein